MLIAMDIDIIFLIDCFFYLGPLFDTAIAGYIQETVTRVTNFYHVRFDVLFCYESNCRAVC